MHPSVGNRTAWFPAGQIMAQRSRRVPQQRVRHFLGDPFALLQRIHSPFRTAQYTEGGGKVRETMAKNIWPELRKRAEKRLTNEDWGKFCYEPTSTAGMALGPYIRPSLVHRAELYRQGLDAWGVTVHLKADKLPIGVRPIIGTPTLSPAETKTEAFEHGVLMAMMILTNGKRLGRA